MNIKRKIALFAAGVVAFMGGGIVAVAQNAEAVTQQQINAYIRDHGGIPPCTWEDGAGQPGKCYRSDGQGDPVVLVPTMPGHDKRVVSLARG